MAGHEMTCGRLRGAWLAAALAAGWAILGPGGTAVRGEPATAAPRAQTADVAAARQRLDSLGGDGLYATDAAGTITEITLEDGSGIGADDLALFGRLHGLRGLRIMDCRDLDDAMVAQLADLRGLETLALTNSGITDAAVEKLVQAFPDLVELDLSSNTNLTGAAIKAISGLARLERLTLLQGRFNDLHMRRLAKLATLEALDLRGNMEAGDMTLAVAGRLPKLKAFKHRSSAVTDEGLRGLAENAALESLFMQDFAITDASGPHLARLGRLSSLEIFRCQGFGSAGVTALAGLPLTRLTLRDLPGVGDPALEVLGKLPRLKRLYLHELASVGDDGLRHLSAARGLEVLDIWHLPRMTDASVEVIAGLPSLKELSIRETGVTEASVARLLAMPKLQSLTFKDNGPLSAASAAKLRSRQWARLDIGSDGGE